MKLMRSKETSPGWAAARLKAALLSLLVAAAIHGLCLLGLLQWMELPLYDLNHRLLPADDRAKGRIVIVGITEDDQQRWGYPIPDGTLTLLLESLIEADARVIGLDIYRDRPEPPEAGEAHRRLSGLLREQEQVIASAKLAVAGSGRILHEIKPPAVLTGGAEMDLRVGFNDLPVDRDGVVRRALLAASDPPALPDPRSHTSLAMQVALAYLFEEGDEFMPQPAAPGEKTTTLGKATFRFLARTDSPYGAFDASGDQVLLDYRGPAIPIVSVTAALDPANRELFNDRIVLIGNVAASTPDIVAVPNPGRSALSGNQRHGVEVHAAIVDQLLRASLYGQPPVGAYAVAIQFAMVVLVGIAAAGFGFTEVRRLWRAAWVLAGLLLLLLAAHISLLLRHWPPLASLLLAASAGIVAGMIARERVYRALMRIFLKITPPPIIKEIHDHRRSLFDTGQVPPTKLVATMMFVDLHGFGKISREKKAEEVMEWVNLVVGRFCDLVMANGGTIVHFTGDGLFAAFGAPVKRNKQQQRREAINAIRAAVALKRAMPEINDQGALLVGEGVDLRVGLATGEVVSGTVGGTNHVEYTLVGPAVVIAARLESHRKADSSPDWAPHNNYRILLCGATAAHLLQWRNEAGGSDDPLLEGLALKTLGQEVIDSHDTAVHRLFDRDAPPS